MADPLSISASVVALVTIAGQLVNGLDRFLTNVKEAPALIRDIRSELTSFRVVLSGLQQLLVPSNFPINRGALINVEDIVTAFTSAVLFFSELETALSSLQAPSSNQIELLSRVRWATKKTRLLELLGRLQWHKLTLTLLLTALNCPSERQAENEQRQFHSNVKDRLDLDKDLERRLKKVESALRRLEVAPPNSMAGFHHDEDDGQSEARTIRYLAGDTVILEHNGHEFELALSESWVYRRNQRRDENLSFRSSVCRQSAWTTLSDLTLADISILSVIALPIDWQELPSLSEAFTSNQVLSSSYEPSTQKDTDEQMQNKFQQRIDELDSGSMRELVRREERMGNWKQMGLMNETKAEPATWQKRKEGLKDFKKGLQYMKKALQIENQVLQASEEASQNKKEALQKRRDDLQNGSGVEREAFLKELDALLEQMDAMLKEIDAMMKERDTMVKETDALLKETDALPRNRDTWPKKMDAMLKEIDAMLKESDASRKIIDTLLKSKNAMLKDTDALLKRTDSILKEK